jgi:hypothetical protein
LDEILRRYPYVLVVATVRGRFADEALPAEVERLEMPGFGTDTINAIRRYFAYYRIDPRDAELPMGLLSNPLTLRLFCEVTNPTRDHEVGVEAMPASLTALFDKYVDQATERIADLVPHRCYLQQDVREAIDTIAGLLWADKARSVELDTLRQTLNDTGRPWTESIVSALEQEGLLVRYPGEPPAKPSMAVVYDALAGHLIADRIITSQGQVGFENWTRQSNNLALLSGPSEILHPLAGDIFNALVSLLPRRLRRQQLWTFLHDPLRTDALRGTAHLEAAYLDTATVQSLAELILQEPIRERNLFTRLWQTRGSPEHPLNSVFLDRVLRRMTLPIRDRSWTEWVRRNDRELIADVERLEQRWRRLRIGRSPSERLRARWLMWMLPSTVRDLRDRATRALYWFGRRDPAFLFVLTRQSLSVNDPYVPERVLASAYGASMALHCRPKRRKFRSNLLPNFAKRIYASMFAPSAPHSTTHVLSRDYARRMIQLALVHAPEALTADEQARTIPPFEDGGLRNWGTMQDPNKDKYRGGNSPLGMDFENYTIGRLVPGRRNYDYDNEEYKSVVGQIVWRIYQLGYSLEMFDQVDKEIAGSRYSGRTDRPPTERYGKKYARIAFFEQYGLRDDAGLLQDDWNHTGERPSEHDIDPSFPDSPHKLRIIADFLGDRLRDVGTWVREGPTPAFDPYLVQDYVGRVAGPWLLLDGRCGQQDKGAERIGFVSFHSFVLLQEDIHEFTRLVATVPEERSFPDREEDDHYTFAGEVSWCDTFPYSLLRTADFVVGKTRVKVREDDPRYGISFSFESDGETHVIRSMRPEYEDVNEYIRIPLYSPVRWNSFSSTSAIERPSCLVPPKEIAERLQLWLDLPTWDTRDPSHRLCSITSGRGAYWDYEGHLFFRKELLDPLLRSDKLALVWVVSGERQHFSERHSMTNAPSHGYKHFQQIYSYIRGKPRRII